MKQKFTYYTLHDITRFTKQNEYKNNTLNKYIL